MKNRKQGTILHFPRQDNIVTFPEQHRERDTLIRDYPTDDKQSMLRKILDTPRVFCYSIIDALASRRY